MSSSTTPALMAHMLEELDITPGMRVREIGTGTGYHAAVLCAALGQDNVFTVDLRPELVSAAGQRLAELGYHPVLSATDGVDGLAEHAPYNRIIATCAVPAIPAAGISQLAPDGILLTDLKGGLSAGNLVKLSRDAGRVLSGRFLPWWAGFMPMRHEQHIAPVPTPQGDASIHRATKVPPSLLDEPVFAFLAQLHLPAGTSLRLRGGDNGSLSTVLVAPNGSWCQVAHEPDSQRRAPSRCGRSAAVVRGGGRRRAVGGAAAALQGALWSNRRTRRAAMAWVTSSDGEHTFALKPAP
ncbi:MAG: protein-L-isoaspartate(D-aspartate) O-methyltransferase [Pseudonocardiales bacterium]|nr:protein-L-isoaspartate(D-aspartate) O-methyltransferase [Pseudonocardiales bacterium]